MLDRGGDIVKPGAFKVDLADWKRRKACRPCSGSTTLPADRRLDELEEDDKGLKVGGQLVLDVQQAKDRPRPDQGQGREAACRSATSPATTTRPPTGARTSSRSTSGRSPWSPSRCCPRRRSPASRATSIPKRWSAPFATKGLSNRDAKAAISVFRKHALRDAGSPETGPRDGASEMLMTLRKATAACATDFQPRGGACPHEDVFTARSLAGRRRAAAHRARDQGRQRRRPDLKAAIDELGKTITDFRTKNDEEIAEIKKGRRRPHQGRAREDQQGDRRGDRRREEARRRARGQGQPPAARRRRRERPLEAKAAAEFGKLVGKKDFTPDQLAEYKAASTPTCAHPGGKAQTLMVGSDPAGGYWVTPDKTGRIVKKVYETTPMRQLANVVTIGTDSSRARSTTARPTPLWAGEPPPGPRPTPADRQVEDRGQRALRLPQGDAEAPRGRHDRRRGLAGRQGRPQVRPQGEHRLHHRQRHPEAARPAGLPRWPTADDTRAWGTFQHVKTGTAGSFGATTNGTDKLLDLIFEVKAAYRQNGQFLMARRTNGGVRKLKDGQGNYAYGVGLRAAPWSRRSSASRCDRRRGHAGLHHRQLALGIASATSTRPTRSSTASASP
jgi:predicted phage gp36 major capsid-like protein